MKKILCHPTIANALIEAGVASEIKDEPKPIDTQNKGDTKSPDFDYLIKTMKLTPALESSVRNAAKKVASFKGIYKQIQLKTGVPWQMVGVIHLMESNCDFKTHLHNGDPLTARTVQIPRGRPLKGNPPFTWEESAIDSLGYDGASEIKVWTPVDSLKFLEAYNGLGYRNKGIYSPYLWSGTNHYTKGKYVADGKWDSEAVSKQCGAAAVLFVLDYFNEQAA